MASIIYWLNLNLALTLLMWMPYILNRIKRQGLAAMGYDENLPSPSAWAQRAQKAHSNAVENLVVLAPAALSYVALKGLESECIVFWLQVYLVTRVIHYLSYTFKVPYVRTLSFISGWGATVALVWCVCREACKQM